MRRNCTLRETEGSNMFIEGKAEDSSQYCLGNPVQTDNFSYFWLLLVRKMGAEVGIKSRFLRAYDR